MDAVALDRARRALSDVADDLAERVLSIFEGAEEVLALRVIARGVLRERLRVNA